jgi:hypothetical protein
VSVHKKRLRRKYLRISQNKISIGKSRNRRLDDFENNLMKGCFRIWRKIARDRNT